MFVQELLGRKDVRTTMIYTQVLNRAGRGVRSPIDGFKTKKVECVLYSNEERYKSKVRKGE